MSLFLDIVVDHCLFSYTDSLRINPHTFHTFEEFNFIMAQRENLQGITALIRAEMAPTGVKGLLKNKKVFFISLFAS